MDIVAKIKGIQGDAEQLYELSPREFEELVAELLASFGWEVSLTPPSRDGGHDILAVSSDGSQLETTWIVECKRYAADRPIGVEIVRRLAGVKVGLNVPQAVIVGTSRFTREAIEFAAGLGDVKVVDKELLLEWVAGYKVGHEEMDDGSGTYLPRMRFQSCFLSYSHKDEGFARKLAGRLREAGIRLWFAPEDLRAGTKLHEAIVEAIGRFDRLIIILSNDSIESPWVQTEIRKARKRELEERIRLLFPISLISFEKLRTWELFDADLGQDLAVELREYLIPDFSDWANPAVFDLKMNALLEGLRSY